MRLWSRMGDEFDASYSMIERQLWDVMDTAQERVTVGALAYIPEVLRETGQERADDPRYEIPQRTLVGTAGNGLGTDSLAYGAVTHAKDAVAAGASASQALAQGGSYLSAAVGTLLSDTGRTAEKLAGNARPISGYVRMLEPPSCGRCVILAGKWTRKSTAFLRHPRCDCRNIPASENVGGDLVTDPADYFAGLDDEQLVKAFGSKANARAYKDGADFNQLINAYRRKGAVSKAQQFGRSIKYTTEGVTRRGHAYRVMSRWSKGPLDSRGRVIVKEARLMPETIYSVAKDQADADRLLRMYGWI